MLTITQAAEAMSLSRVCVWQWIKQGKLHAERESGGRRRWLISEEDIAPHAVTIDAKRNNRMNRRLDDMAYRARCTKKLEQLAEYHGMPRVRVVEALVEREWQKTLGGKNGSK